MRLFVAVDPSEAVRARLRAALEPLRPLARDAKWAGEEGLHVTLVFLGETDDAAVPAITAALASAAALHRAFELSFGGGGSFGSPAHPRVLWAGVGGDREALADLQRDVAAALGALGHRGEDRAFSPHLTLARARAPRGDPALAACASALAADLGPSTIAEVVLYRSDPGARYTALARLPLSR